jgi:hypothetical protein
MVNNLDILLSKNSEKLKYLLYYFKSLSHNEMNIIHNDSISRI